jgi:hypothetical protein
LQLFWRDAAVPGIDVESMEVGERLKALKGSIM